MTVDRHCPTLEVQLVVRFHRPHIVRDGEPMTALLSGQLSPAQGSLPRTVISSALMGMALPHLPSLPPSSRGPNHGFDAPLLKYPPSTRDSSTEYFEPKKVARRIHPILGTPIQVLRNLVSPTKREASQPSVHPSRRPKRDIFHAAGYGDPNAERPDPKLCILERRAKEKKIKEDGQAFRRTHAIRPIPGTFTYGPGSFSEAALKSKGASSRLAPQPGPSKLRTTGTFKRDKSLSGLSARQQSQKLRSVGNLARQDASRDLARELSMNLSSLSLNLGELPPQPRISLDSVEARFSEIVDAGGSLTKEQEILLKEVRRMAENEEQVERFDERCFHKERAEKLRRKNVHDDEPERPAKRVRMKEQLVEPAEPKGSQLTDHEEETPRPRNRYGLRPENSSFTVYEKVPGGYARNEEATRAAKERKEREEREIQEEAERRAEEQRRVREERAKHDPFQTETRKPSGRRVAATGGYHTRSRPRQAPVPTPKQLVADASQHAEFLQRARQAEENDRRMEKEARRIKEFQERVRLQEEEEARREAMKLEQQRLNEQFQRNMEEWRRSQAGPSHHMNVDGVPGAPSIEDRIEEYDKRWDNLTQKGARDLRFSDMPWPVLCDTRDLSSLTPANIEPFVAHSLRRAGTGGDSLKQLLKSDLLMWHPDRFTKYRKRIVRLHWPMVQEGVNIVAQVLINMKRDLARFA